MSNTTKQNKATSPIQTKATQSKTNITQPRQTTKKLQNTIKQTCGQNNTRQTSTAKHQKQHDKHNKTT